MCACVCIYIYYICIKSVDKLKKAFQYPIGYEVYFYKASLLFKLQLLCVDFCEHGTGDFTLVFLGNHLQFSYKLICILSKAAFTL